MPSYTVYIVEGAYITHTIDRELAHMWSLEKMYWESNTQVNQSVPITLQAEAHPFVI
jgi:hypothetical protein